jgi:hypothetical protein
MHATQKNHMCTDSGCIGPVKCLTLRVKAKHYETAQHFVWSKAEVWPFHPFQSQRDTGVHGRKYPLISVSGRLAAWRAM